MLTLVRIIRDREKFQSTDIDGVNIINIFKYSKCFRLQKDDHQTYLYVKGNPGFIRLFGVASLLSEDSLIGFISENNLGFIYRFVDICDSLKWEKGIFSISLVPEKIPGLLYSKKYGCIRKRWKDGKVEKSSFIPFFNSQCFILSKGKFFALGGFSKEFFPDHLHEIDLSIRALKKGFSHKIVQIPGVRLENEEKRILSSFYKEKNAITLNFKYLSKIDKLKNIAFILRDTPFLLKTRDYQKVTGRFAGLVRNAVCVD